MDQFFQTLRKIQKKERNNATLARVEETFYQDIHEYLNQLKRSASEDLFAEEYTLIKDTRRVATEICERREHKITDAAVVNIHRSYHLFSGKPEFDLVDTTPLNLTPEEETFYFSLIDALREHRNNISLSKISTKKTKNEEVRKSKEEIDTSSKDTTLEEATEINQTLEESIEDDVPKAKPVVLEENKKDKTLDRLDEISKGKVITDEKRKPIEKQINKPLENEVIDNPYEDKFVDFESKKLAKDQELVTLLIFEETEAIIGVDEKIYGPFFPQDLVVMPKINAMVFVKNRKGRIVNI